MTDRYKQTLGKAGEALAIRFLRHKGYKVLARNFACRFGEIDIIARQERTTVFVEVKARRSERLGLPEEALNSKKIKHLRRTAQYYIKEHADPEGLFRFDVVSIILEDSYKLSLIEDAF